MRLYVVNKLGKKVILDVIAPDRKQLASKIGQEFSVKGFWYSVNDVFAESSGNDTAGGAIIGGLLGLFAGGVGVIIGGVAGGVIGGIIDENEQENINHFNKSIV